MTPLPLTPSRLYRLLHTGTEGDTGFYARAAEGASSVLDLGVGWGRIALPLVQAGYDVVGVDLEAAFLNEAAQALTTWQTTSQGERALGSLRLLQHDVRHLDLNERFDRVFIGYNTLYAMGGKDGATEVLRRAKAHLKTDGELWLDVYAMDEFHQSALSGEAPGDDETREEVFRENRDDGTLVIFEVSALNLNEQRLDVRYEAELDGRDVGSASLTHHYLLLPQIMECLEQAGLEAAALFGGFSLEPADETTQHIVVCAVPQDGQATDPGPAPGKIR